MRRGRTPAVMFQGTASGVGKSLLTAALLRVLRQDGFSCAPFKAQNMSLNSYVTLRGEEMGRAQVMQAQAAGVEPDVRMNPILLKPSADTLAQVIVNGKPVGHMDFRRYTGNIDERFAIVSEAYDSLAREHEVIVLEGAGSPAEINLKDRDIVNMRMARHAGARVLVAGDIDKGGVFASFIGVMETLDGWERDLVAGFIANKFRGDKTLLGGALDYTLARTGRPVMGVVPYLHDLHLPDEDSPVIRKAASKRDGGEKVKIAVLRLRHVSNFTDFDPLGMEPDVELSAARSPEEIDGADAVIIPGSKNTVSDLARLVETGMADGLKKLAAGGGVEIIGICGGFQMLGSSIADPEGVEFDGAAGGLGLLPVRTAMLPGKTLGRTQALHLASGLRVHGYEIHHGVTDITGAWPLMRADGGEIIGAQSGCGMIWGTYLHGVFDSDEFRRWFIDRLRVRKGLKPAGAMLARYDLEPQFDRLAAALRESVDIGEIYRLAGF